MTSSTEDDAPPVSARSAGESPGLPLTLGRLLDGAGRRLARRTVPDLPWSAPLFPVLARADELNGFQAGRFDRAEVDPVPAGRAAVPRLAAGAATRPQADPAGTGASPGPALRGGDPSWSAPEPLGGRAPDAPRQRGGSGRHLDGTVRTRLRPLVGRAADELRLHDDEVADGLARFHGADAVTVGRDVHVRRGRLDPRDPRSLGLLVHEATHVEQLLRYGAAAQRASESGRREEEHAALARERRVARGHDIGGDDGGHNPGAGLARGAPEPATGRVGVSPGTAASGVVAAAAVPMAAATDRDAGSPAAWDIESLKRAVIADLRRQLRGEFERGA